MRLPQVTWKSVAGAHSGKKGEAIGQDSKKGANYARGTPKEECHSTFVRISPLGKCPKVSEGRNLLPIEHAFIKTIVTFTSHTPG